ncbi:MAG TPA: DUF2786 domain-containing protein [Acidimicrobiales bacterium]|jgi:hypothetical protein|nr:DUF2786 domain-containing protein [Acidimicrobiales bacterium]
MTEIVESVLFNAAHWDCENPGRPAGRSPLLDDLVSGFGVAEGRELVAGRLRSMVASELKELCQAGWGPEDIAHIVRRRAGATASAMVAGLFPFVGGSEFECAAGPWGRTRVLDAASPGWRSDLLATIDALGLLQHLPELPDLGLATRSATPQSADEARLLARIRALLAKAESSEFPDEADAFSAKAQQLITQHRLDRALLEVTADGRSGDSVEARRVWLEDPYLQAKAMLLGVVAAANRCRAVVSPKLGFSTIVGHGADLDATELLFTSLLVQATRRLTALGHATNGSRARRPSFRRSFFVSYAGRIGARLSEADSSATAEAEKEFGSRLLPVLARREGEVDDTVNRLFGRLDAIDCSPTDLAGWAAGAAAADMSDLAFQDALFEAAS